MGKGAKDQKTLDRSDLNDESKVEVWHACYLERSKYCLGDKRPVSLLKKKKLGPK